MICYVFCKLTFKARTQTTDTGASLILCVSRKHKKYFPSASESRTLLQSEKHLSPVIIVMEFSQFRNKKRIHPLTMTHFHTTFTLKVIYCGPNTPSRLYPWNISTRLDKALSLKKKKNYIEWLTTVRLYTGTFII